MSVRRPLAKYAIQELLDEWDLSNGFRLLTRLGSADVRLISCRRVKTKWT
jgi:hypothetical protein